MADSNHSISEQLALEFFSRVWTPPNDLDAIDELMTEDYVLTSGLRFAIERVEQPREGRQERLVVEALASRIRVRLGHDRSEVEAGRIEGGLGHGVGVAYRACSPKTCARRPTSRRSAARYLVRIRRAPHACCRWSRSGAAATAWRACCESARRHPRADTTGSFSFFFGSNLWKSYKKMGSL